MRYYHIFCTVILLIYSLTATAVTRTAVNTARWEQASTWSGGTVPACGDTIIIPAGFTVEVSSVLDFSLCAQPMHVVISGILTFQIGKKLKLPCNSSITINTGGSITAGGGGGNSNLIDICNTTVWNAAQGTVNGPVVFVVNPLPVQLAHMEAVPSENGIMISWVTLSEKNNAYFTIEKSGDGKNFEEVGRVNGFGTTSQPHSYIFIDKELINGITYYRIKQTDFDGGFSYSKPIFVKWEDKIELRVYPNPTYGDLFMNIGDQYRRQSCRLLVHSQAGKTILVKDLVINHTGYGIKLLNESEFLKPGNYIVTVEFDAQKFTQHIIIK